MPNGQIPVKAKGILPARAATSFPHRGASGITVGPGSPFLKAVAPGGDEYERRSSGLHPSPEPNVSARGLPPPKGMAIFRYTILSPPPYFRF